MISYFDSQFVGGRFFPFRGTLINVSCFNFSLISTTVLWAEQITAQYFWRYRYLRNIFVKWGLWHCYEGSVHVYIQRDWWVISPHVEYFISREKSAFENNIMKSRLPAPVNTPMKELNYALLFDSCQKLWMEYSLFNKMNESEFILFPLNQNDNILTICNKQVTKNENRHQACWKFRIFLPSNIDRSFRRIKKTINFNFPEW